MSSGNGSESDRAMTPPEAMSSPELTEDEMICNICLVRAGPCVNPNIDPYHDPNQFDPNTN